MYKVYFGDQKENVYDVLKQMKKEKIIERLMNKDFTLWGDEPTEISNRLGWLDSPKVMMETIGEIESFVYDVIENEFTHVLLLGMGGSSLAPEVFRLTFGLKPGHPDLTVIDSTDPDMIFNITEKLKSEKTLYIVSTKSGGTVETISLMKYFYHLEIQRVGTEHAGDSFVAITDPLSKLQILAEKMNFREIFLNDPNIGGRYSALSYFGLVPAALIGVDLQNLLGKSFSILEECHSEVVSESGEICSASLLGALMGEMAFRGKDKITFIGSEKLKYFGAWAEQLIAESTGKNGKGILPVDGEELLDPEFYSNDRYFVSIRLKSEEVNKTKIPNLIAAGFPLVDFVLDDIYELGGEFLRWEIATVIAGWKMGIQPFNQPNVESAKILAREMVEKFMDEGSLPFPEPAFTEGELSVYTEQQNGNLEETVKSFLSSHSAGDENGSGRSYISIHAYLTPDERISDTLQEFRSKIQKDYKLAATVGYGPRFLHSTGQLHKGDGGNGLFIQLTSSCLNDVAIPDIPGKRESHLSFGVLINSQALGDRAALIKGGRKVLWIDLGNNAVAGIRKIMTSI